MSLDHHYDKMLWELHHQLEMRNNGRPNILDGSAINLHPENWAEWQRSWSRAGMMTRPTTEPPVFAGMRIYPTTAVPEGVLLVLKHDQLLATVNVDTGTITTYLEDQFEGKVRLLSGA